MRFLIHSLASKYKGNFVLCLQLCDRLPCTCHVGVCKALLLASKFPTFYDHFSCKREFLIIRINEINTTQSSGIVDLRFFDCPLLLLFAFRRIGHIFPNLWQQSVWPGSHLFSCQSPPGQSISIWWFFIQNSESCEICPCI